MARGSHDLRRMFRNAATACSVPDIVVKALFNIRCTSDVTDGYSTDVEKPKRDAMVKIERYLTRGKRSLMEQAHGRKKKALREEGGLRLQEEVTAARRARPRELRERVWSEIFGRPPHVRKGLQESTRTRRRGARARRISCAPGWGERGNERPMGRRSRRSREHSGARVPHIQHARESKQHDYARISQENQRRRRDAVNDVVRGRPVILAPLPTHPALTAPGLVIGPRSRKGGRLATIKCRVRVNCQSLAVTA